MLMWPPLTCTQLTPVAPAATRRATVTTGGLNRVKVSSAVRASTPGMSHCKTVHFPPSQQSYDRGDSNPAAPVSPLTLAAWNVCSLLDNPRINRLERRTVLVARELGCYKVEMAALSEIRFSEQGQLEEVGASYTFSWSGRESHNTDLPVPRVVGESEDVRETLTSTVVGGENGADVDCGQTDARESPRTSGCDLRDG
ncbi:unnamed protein product [Schistocephalus solidus]|uniref:Uncharacterized protein n=1 Tax=Schistocephalus solidus TaxID=70667 RepID=A0A183SI60_SCHSO|nr:unnamed protein product [Schistocephalus solidus]